MSAGDPAAETLRIPTADGWSLAASRLPAAGPQRHVAVLSHAMFVSRTTLSRLAAALAQHGITCWTVDLRGHGDSGPGAEHADWSYADIVLRDIPAAVHALAAQEGVRPVWVGHSLAAHGGLAAWALEPTLPLSGLVSLGGNLWMSRFFPHRATWLAREATLLAWASLTRAVGRFPVRRLGLGSDDEAQRYVHDLVHIARRDRFELEGRDVLAALSRLEGRVLSITSRGDTWMCAPAVARAFLGHAERARVVHREVGEAPGEPGHPATQEAGVDHMGLVLDKRMASVFAEAADFVASCAG